jgi:hypothetical protein
VVSCSLQLLRHSLCRIELHPHLCPLVVSVAASDVLLVGIPTAIMKTVDLNKFVRTFRVCPMSLPLLAEFVSSVVMSLVLGCLAAGATAAPGGPSTPRGFGLAVSPIQSCIVGKLQCGRMYVR